MRNICIRLRTSAFKPDNFCKHLGNSSESLLCVNGVWWDVFGTLSNICDGPLTQKLLTSKRPKYFLIKTLSYMFHKTLSYMFHLILRYGHLHILQFQQFQYKRKHCTQIYKKDGDSRWKVRIHQMKYPFNNGPPNQCQIFVSDVLALTGFSDSYKKNTCVKFDYF